MTIPITMLRPRGLDLLAVAIRNSFPDVVVG
jgi:hypothetical protein